MGPPLDKFLSMGQGNTGPRTVSTHPGFVGQDNSKRASPRFGFFPWDESMSVGALSGMGNRSATQETLSGRPGVESGPRNEGHHGGVDRWGRFRWFGLFSTEYSSLL